MLTHLLSFAIRNLRRFRLFTGINILGLAFSIAVFLALTGYVRYHFSYDSFYKDGNRMYRVEYAEEQAGLPVLETARTHSRTALLLHAYVPEAEAVARIYYEKAYIFTEDVKIPDQHMLFADSSFFKVFDVKVLAGSAETGLVAPHSVMISQSQAKAYFGDADPMGKSMYFNEGLHVTVTGVFEDIPETSSVDFDFLISWSTTVFYGWGSKDGSFDSPGNFTFVKLNRHVSDIDKINRSLSRMAAEHIATLEKRGHTGRYSLRPYEELHFARGLSGELKPGMNKNTLYALLALAFFILATGLINYLNLSLARSIERAGEIAVRRVFGAARRIIAYQFLIEAVIILLVSLSLGFATYQLFAGPMAGLLFDEVTFAPLDLDAGVYLIAFVIGLMLVSIYPAWFISKYKPAVILRNRLGGKSSAGLLYRSLLIFQLFLAVSILGMTLVAGNQVRYMRNLDAGFDAGNVVALNAPASTNSDSLRPVRYRAFRDEVLQHPAFVSGTSSFNIPGEEIRFHDDGVQAVGASNEKKHPFWILWVDEGYQETFGLTLLSGRNFNQKEFGNCLINETASKALGYQQPEDAVNTKLILTDGSVLTIAGVWKDYHHQSMHQAITPVIYVHRHPFEYGYYSFLIQPGRDGKYLETLNDVWKKHYPNDPFIHRFMNAFFERQYQSDQLFERLLSIFSVISLVVAVLGLFGMASLAIAKRTKEIGVRKVLGAGVTGIVTLLSAGYLRLVLISCALAFPLIYYATTQWLGTFAYHVDFSPWMLLAPALIVTAIVVFTVATQSMRAARANPVDALREN